MCLFILAAFLEHSNRSDYIVFAINLVVAVCYGIQAVSFQRNNSGFDATDEIYQHFPAELLFAVANNVKYA